MAVGSDNVFPKLILSEGAAPATPAAGQTKLYAKADGLLYSKDDAGTETGPFGATGGGSTVTTANAQQGANVAITAATYINVVSVSLAAGTWDIWAWLTFGNVIGGACDNYAQLWDGSAQIAQAVTTNPDVATNNYLAVPIFAPSVVLGSTTTIYLRGYSDFTATAMGSTALGAGGGSKIHARKIA